jgi:cation transporter-like permease
MNEEERQPGVERVRELPREESHPLIHDVHREEAIDHGTLFYVKEYGSGAVVWRTILRESLPVLVLASLLSSLGGGTVLEHSKETIFALTPFLILLPALNDMIGDFGIIVSSRVSELCYQQDVADAWWREFEIRRLFAQVVVAATVTALATALAALSITAIGHDAVGPTFALRVVAVVVLDVLLLTSGVFVLAVLAGREAFRRGRDPNNFLIPITTSVADVLNILLLTGLILLFF